MATDLPRRLSRLPARARAAVERVRNTGQERHRVEAALADLERRAGFVPPGHYYSPIPSLEEFERDHPRIYQHVDRVEVPGVDLRDDAHLEMFELILRYLDEQPFGHEPGDDRRYHFDNDMFGFADAIALYTMLRSLRPARVVEVGSGYSSAVMLDTRERFLADVPHLTFVEPYADRLRSLLRPDDHDRVTLHEARVQDVALEIFDDLRSGDILFVDSSHVSRVGSDVNHLLFEVLPRLAPGVVVHLHDIGWPFEYPESWIREGRAWNEAYLVRAFLQYNESFEIVFYGAYAQTVHRAWFEEHLPGALDVGFASLWLRRTG